MKGDIGISLLAGGQLAIATWMLSRAQGLESLSWTCLWIFSLSTAVFLFRGVMSGWDYPNRALVESIRKSTEGLDKRLRAEVTAYINKHRHSLVEGLCKDGKVLIPTSAGNLTMTLEDLKQETETPMKRTKLAPRSKRQHYTDYPIIELGDKLYTDAPIRPVTLLSYDGNKYVTVQVAGVVDAIKWGYIYTRAGRHGEAPRIHQSTLQALPATVWAE